MVIALHAFVSVFRSSNTALAAKIAEKLGTTLGELQTRRFSDGEIFVEIKENVRGRDVYIIQSTCAPVNDNLMELLVIVDALKRASVNSITTVIPYYGYARQDRKVAPRTPSRQSSWPTSSPRRAPRVVVSADLHAGQIQGFFNIPFDNLLRLAGATRIYQRAIRRLMQRHRLRFP